MATILKPSYAASAALVTTHLLSLASDVNLLAGWSSAVIDNTANLSVTEKITGKIKTGTSPSVGLTIPIYVWSALDDTPTYPDVLTGAEGLFTITSLNVFNSFMKWAQTITVDATTGRIYPFSFDVAALFGGQMPKKYGLFIVQNTSAALDATTQVISRGDVTQYTNV